MAIGNMEGLIYGPGGGKNDGAWAKIEAALEAAKRQKIQNIEVECRKTPEGTNASSTDWTARFPVADKGPDEIAVALLAKLQASPSDDFRGTIRLNFREAGKTSNHLESIERKIEPGGAVAIPAGATVSAELHYRVTNDLMEQNRRTLLAASQVLEKGVQVIAGAATLVQALGDQARGTQEKAQGAGGAAAILGQTLGVLATGVTQGPEAGARAAAAAVANNLTAPDLKKPGQDSSSASSEGGRKWTKEDAEAWARENPAEARELGIKLWQGGL